MAPALKLYNTLSRQLEEFSPLEPGNVKMYVCGPTVYDEPHLGHARCYLTWDVLYRLLKFLGYDVRYVRNLTDVDDKILNRAKDRGVSCEVVTDENIKAFDAAMAALNNLKPTDEPKATVYVEAMQAMISALIEKGFAYATVDGDVYYRTGQKHDYGKLCHQNLDDLKAGERVEVDPDKESPLDFALWKHAKPEEQLFWESPWGKGRPGWHIECSTMIHEVLGQQIDIHAGGYDLVFPHHENEIAQSEAFTGCAPFAKYWLHNGFVNVSGEKMSKSLGNFETIQGLLKGYSADAIRYFVLTNHYRMPVDFSEEALDGAENRIKKMSKQITALCQELSPNEAAVVDETHPDVMAFKDAMCSDMNTAKALASLNALFDAARQKDKHALEQFLVLSRQVLGFGFHSESQSSIELPASALAVLGQYQASSIDELIEKRLQARQSKNWALSDEIRDALKAAGVNLLDSKTGTTAWELV